MYVSLYCREIVRLFVYVGTMKETSSQCDYVRVSEGLAHAVKVLYSSARLKAHACVTSEDSEPIEN